MSKKLVLVTGALGGIGTAICEKFAAEEYRIIATYLPGVEDDLIEPWRHELELADDQVRFLPLDVTNNEDCAETLKTLLQEEGCIDVLVNNAGITRDSTFKKMTADKWYAVIDTNLNSLFNVTQPLFQTMCERGDARVINISSVNGQKGQFGQANYSAAKAGILGFTKALAAEGARAGVTVNAVAPGYTGTPMVQKIKPEILESIKQEVPMKRLAEPSEIAEAVWYLASPAGAYVTGETLSINGGLYMS